MPFVLFFTMPPSSPLMCQGCPSRCHSGSHSHRSCAMDALRAVLHDAPIITVPRMPVWMPLASLMCNGCPSCCCSRCHHHHRSCAKDAFQYAPQDTTRIAHVQWMPFMLFFMMPASSPLMCQGCPSRCPSGCHSHRSCAMDALQAVLHDAPSSPPM